LTDEINLKNQVEFLYNATAKELYNLALYSVQNQPLAEQLTIDAFAFAFNSLSDKSDAEQFRMKSIKFLYRSIKKSVSKANRGPGKLKDQRIYENTEFPKSKERTRLNTLRLLLECDERFILLLFCYQKFSVKRISRILNLPTFIAKKSLHITITKAIELWRIYK
jgi:DNA-directed RNA polymerase specialized sigma24 family protein